YYHIHRHSLNAPSPFHSDFLLRQHFLFLSSSFRLYPHRKLPLKLWTENALLFVRGTNRLFPTNPQKILRLPDTETFFFVFLSLLQREATIVEQHRNTVIYIGKHSAYYLFCF